MIQPKFAFHDGVIGLWNMLDGDGLTVRDTAANGLDMTMTSGLTWTNDTKYGYGVTGFNNTARFLQTTSTSELSSNEATVELVCYLTSSTAYRNLLCKRDADDIEFQLSVIQSSSKRTFNQICADSYDDSTPSALISVTPLIAENAYYYICGRKTRYPTYDTVKIVVAKLDDPATLYSASANSNSNHCIQTTLPVTMGKLNGTTSGYLQTGDILFGCRWWNKALSDEEVGFNAKLFPHIFADMRLGTVA